MPQLTPVRAAVAVAALLLAVLGIAYAVSQGTGDKDPADPGKSTPTAADPTPTTVATVSPTTKPSFTTMPVPSSTQLQSPGTRISTTAPASSYSPRPTPTTTDITSDMGPGTHDGDGE